VKIDIPSLLVHLRGRVVRERTRGALGGRLDGERLAMRAVARAFSTPKRYEAAQRAARAGQFPFARGGSIERLPPPLGAWTAVRDMRPVPPQTFREWWRERERKGGGEG
jgi:L-lactate dehydrogenase complex protein LldF